MKKYILGVSILAMTCLTGCQSNEDAVSNTNVSEITEESITLEEAKQIALDDEDGEVVKESQDYSDGLTYFEIDIVRETIKYEYEIDSKGNIISKEQDTYTQGTTTNSTVDYINQEEAQNIVITHAGGGTIYECELDRDDGRATYEIELIKDSVKYDAIVDAITGEVLLFSQDY